MKLRTILLPLAIVLGLLIPQAHVLAFAMRWIIATMMFLAFVGPLRATWGEAARVLVRLMPIWLLLGPLCALVLRMVLPHHLEYSWAALLIGLAPTGNAAPSVAALRGGEPRVVIPGVLVQHLLVGFLVSFWVWMFGGGLLGADVPLRILRGTLPLIVAPLVAAWAVRKALPSVAEPLHRRQGVSLLLWALAVFLVVAQARYELGCMNLFASGAWAWAHLAGLSALALLMCIILFKLGLRMGGKGFPEESSQILGQKNTILAIWIASTWFGPWVALGPLSYVLWQNLYLAWQTK